MLRINVVTLFPDWFTAALASSILGRAAQAGVVQYRVVQLRGYTHDKHQKVDDAPYGGGAGMVLKVEPMVEAVEDLKVVQDRKSTRLNSSHLGISYAVFCLKKKKKKQRTVRSADKDTNTHEERT